MLTKPDLGMAWALIIMMGGITASAQPAQQRTVESGGVIFQSAEQVGMEETVTGSPYTATAVIESTQLLADGNRFQNRSTQRLARDSQGRTRREESIGKVGSLQLPDGPTIVFIHDPVLQIDYALDTAQHTVKATKSQKVDMPVMEQFRQVPLKSSETSEQPSPRRRQVTRETLGTQVIEGLTTTRVRITSTIPAGLFGNERPFAVSVESWYSPDLHVTVLRKRTDPRVGETTYRLTDIRRVEPDPSLFQVPADYKGARTPQ